MYDRIKKKKKNILRRSARSPFCPTAPRVVSRLPCLARGAPPPSSCCVVRVRLGVEFALFNLQKKMGVMLMFTAPGHDAIVMELGRQVVEFDEGKIVEVRSLHFGLG